VGGQQLTHLSSTAQYWTTSDGYDHRQGRQVTRLRKRDRATGVCYAYVRKVHCAVVGSCYASGRAQNISVSRSRRFTEGWVTFGEYFTWKGASPTNHCWFQKTRVIALSCGVKISAVHHLVLSQYTHLSDRRTELRQ